MTKIIRNKEQLYEAKEELRQLKETKKRILDAQSYTIGVEQLNRVNFRDISEQIEAYEKAIDDYETKGSTKRSVRRVIPMG